jgi:hypothetical protein
MKSNALEENASRLNCEKTTLQKKHKRYEILDFLLSCLENNSIRYKEQLLPFIFHSQTIEALVKRHWNKVQIEKLKNSIFNSVQNLPDVEVMQDVPLALYLELKKLRQVPLIFNNRIVPIPGNITNALLCGIMAENFTESELRLCGVFTKIRGSDINGEPSEVWRLDISPHYSRKGFILPIIERGIIADLCVFRHPNDNRPFILRARFDFMDETREGYENIT